MPAKAGIHAFPAESEPCQRRNVPAARPTTYFFGFSNKRRRSRLCNTSANSRRKQKFFCFFFFKKRSAYLPFLLFPSFAHAYDNTACWHYAEQQGPRPDITCVPITAALLQSLQNATPAQLASIFNEPGETFPDGTIHYTGNDLNNDGGYQGTIILTLNAGQVAAIDATLDDPNQGGAYLHYHWSAGAFCSDLPGAGPVCPPSQ